MLATASILTSILFSVACALFAWRFLLACEGQKYRRAFWLKGAAGVCFVAVGTIMALGDRSEYAWKVLCGLTLGLAGDQLLAARFIFKER